MEEYQTLLDGLESRNPNVMIKKVQKISKPKRKGTPDPKMSRALKKANEMGRKKSGGFKKGWSQGKIMSKAHKLRRSM
jgi:hypothetical protein